MERLRQREIFATLAPLREAELFESFSHRVSKYLMKYFSHEEQNTEQGGAVRVEEAAVEGENEKMPREAEESVEARTKAKTDKEQ